MKKTFIFLLALSLLTACGNETDSSSNNENTAQNLEPTEIENTTEPTADDINNVCVWESDTVIYENLDDFLTQTSRTRTSSQIVPKFDESKYEITRVLQSDTSYTYHFKSLLNPNTFSVVINQNTSYHTFEEMVEVANLNHVLEVENIHTTVWGDTPALIQSVQFSDPIEYIIYAMIDENNRVYLSGDMTPEELTATLNDFTFK